MIKNFFLVAFAVSLSVPARAGVVAPAAASGHAWVSPVAGVFSAVGTRQIATLGSPALTALSTLDAGAKYPFASAPQVLDLLAKNILPYATPESFAAMPVEDKLIALRAAAKGAELEASAIADESLASAKSRPLHPSSVDGVSRQVAQAEAVSLYLDAPRREELARTRARIASFISKWRKRLKTFEEELPGKIAAGAFDASNILVKTEHGWVAADESPYPIGDDLAKFYERRTQALDKAPRGPWSIQESSLLILALGRPEIGRGKSWSAPALEKLQNVIYSAQAAAGGDRALGDAAYAFEMRSRYGRLVEPRHLLAVEKHYRGVVDAAPSQPTPIRLRMMASILNGAGGLPSWESFKDSHSLTLSWTRRRGMVAGGLVIAGMLSLVLLSPMIGAWPLAAKLAGVAFAWLAPMIAFVRYVWQTAKLESTRLREIIEERLLRTFPRYWRS